MKLFDMFLVSESKLDHTFPNLESTATKFPDFPSVYNWKYYM